MMKSDRLWIENDRLLIHKLVNQDLDLLTAMRNDSRVYRFEPTFLAERQGTPEEALLSLQNMDLIRDRQCILGVYERTRPDVLTGLAEFYDYKASGKVISIGVRLRAEYWGKGIGSACVAAMLDHIQRNTEVELVTAHIIPDNIGSSRMCLKNGFVYLLTKPEDWGHDEPTVADVYTFDC